MARSHTTIGATTFHFCVRNGNRWYWRAIAVRRNLLKIRKLFFWVPSTGVSWLSVILWKRSFFLFFFFSFFSVSFTLHTPCKTIRCCMVKTHGKLVSVSFIRHRTSTSDLSTSSSRTYLQVACATGMTYLRVCFPLRCFQRLSVPNLATGRCHWHDNPYTSGSFTPVLSY